MNYAVSGAAGLAFEAPLSDGRVCSQHRALEEVEGGVEVDEEARDVDEGGDEGGGGVGGVEAAALEDEGEHGAGDGAPEDDADEGDGDGDSEEDIMRAVIFQMEILPEDDAAEADETEGEA